MLQTKGSPPTRTMQLASLHATDGNKLDYLVLGQGPARFKRPRIIWRWANGLCLTNADESGMVLGKVRTCREPKLL